MATTPDPDTILNGGAGNDLWQSGDNDQLLGESGADRFVSLGACLAMIAFSTSTQSNEIASAWAARINGG